MRSQIKLILIAAVVLLLIGFLYVRRERQRAIVEGNTANSQSSHDSTTINANGPRLVKNYREVLGHPLPPFTLAKASGETLAENSVREGNVVLFFIAADCRACMENSEFFKSVSSTRSDVRCYGVRPYDKKSEPDESYANTIPFAVYFDVDHKLSRHMGIRGVPVAVFLKDGVIKKIWGGVAREEQDKLEFNSWLSSF